VKYAENEGIFMSKKQEVFECQKGNAEKMHHFATLWQNTFRFFPPDRWEPERMFDNPLNLYLFYPQILVENQFFHYGRSGIGIDGTAVFDIRHRLAALDLLQHSQCHLAYDCHPRQN
jgi:hypothetical protein